jgi:DNA gyrase/topoisomerase IV subunit B
MQIAVYDVEQTSTLFTTLMGKQVAPRKEFLLKHAEEANV